MRIRSAPTTTLLAAIALSAPAAAGGDSCSCVNDLPPSQVIASSEMIETGGPPTMFVGVNGIQDATVSHANEFILAAPFRITHVCVATDPQNDALEPEAEIRIKVHDPSTDAPKEQALSVTKFTVETHELGYEEQVIELEHPVIVSGHFWVEVAYLKTDAGYAHQGTRPHPPYPTTRSMVRVDTSPVSTPQWYDYEEQGVFGQVRAVIRILELAPAPQECDVTVTPIGWPETSESGKTAVFSIRLTGGPPSAPVAVVGRVPARGGEALVVDPVEIFDLFDWDVPKTMTVIGLDDPFVDGEQPFTFWLEVNSLDPCFDVVIVPAIQMVNLDNDGVLDGHVALPAPQLPPTPHAYFNFGSILAGAPKKWK